MELLRAIRYQSGRVGLRQWARLAGVHPHSAERFLKELVSERLVTHRGRGKRTWYAKNASHADWVVLEAMFDAGDRAMRDVHRAALDQRARSILPFIEEAGEMLSRARG